MRNLLIAAVAAASLAAPLAAQSSQNPNAPRAPLPYDRGYDKDSPRTEAIDAAGRPGVQAANDAVLAQGTKDTTTVAYNAADVNAYRAALIAHHYDVRNYARQERAYAKAMMDWRAQVDACRAGAQTACNLPSPNPADYM